MYYEPFVVDDRAFTDTFGVGATSLEPALAVTVAWYRGPGAYVLEQLVP